jgi:hypothetical protein
VCSFVTVTVRSPRMCARLRGSRITDRVSLSLMVAVLGSSSHRPGRCEVNERGWWGGGVGLPQIVSRLVLNSCSA